MTLTLNLTDVATLKRLLKKAQTEPNQAAGQNFLICPEVVEATTVALDPTVPKVTELGAGLGVLTQALVHHNWQVRAIERDTALAKLLPKSARPKSALDLTVIEADLRHHDWTWPEPYQLVGNIPYNLSGFIIRRLTTTEPAPRQVVFLVQKEVGERLIAGPACPSLLTLAIQLWGQASLLTHVPANCFWPAPKVDSMLILLSPKADRLPLKQREAIIDFARPAYQHQRKQALGSLRTYHEIPAADLSAQFEALHVATTARPAELSVHQWHALTDAFASN